MRKIISNHRSVLRDPVPEDVFLSKMKSQAPSHAFLANCVQSVYARQVMFLSAILQDYFNRQCQGIHVLDWGCGKGHITYLLKAKGFEVTSCDINEHGADSTFGQETPIIDKLGIPVVPLQHKSKLPFEDEMFDCVVSFGVLEHVYSDRDSLSELRRVLKPRGILFVTFLPYYLSWTQAVARLRGNHYHDRLYNVKRLDRLAAEAGFRTHVAQLAQLFPKNSMPLSLDRILEPVDRFLCAYSPLKFLATNIEAVLEAC